MAEQIYRADNLRMRLSLYFFLESGIFKIISCYFQVTVWGDYGRIEGKKVFMGVAQIMLDDINLSNIVIGWYKLFGTTSLVSYI